MIKKEKKWGKTFPFYELLWISVVSGTLVFCKVVAQTWIFSPQSWEFLNRNIFVFSFITKNNSSWTVHVICWPTEHDNSNWHINLSHYSRMTWLSEFYCPFFFFLRQNWFCNEWFNIFNILILLWATSNVTGIFVSALSEGNTSFALPWHALDSYMVCMTNHNLALAN